VEHLLHQSPRQHGIEVTRWRLADVGRALSWLAGCSVPGIYKVLKRLGFSRKQAQRFIHSPDPEYALKWRAILAAYQDAMEHPERVVLLFGDELTYRRRPEIRAMHQRRGRRQHRLAYRPAANTQTRLVAVVNAGTGQVTYRQRSKVGRWELAGFYEQVRLAYPHAQRLYLVLDNWPTHKHPLVLAAARRHGIRLLFLPTYASWLNPVERLWRWLRQDVLHCHPFCDDLQQLRDLTAHWLDRFQNGSRQLLYFIGLLTAEELNQNAC
jgi:transposase